MATIVSRSSVTSSFFACGELWPIRLTPEIRGLADAYSQVRSRRPKTCLTSFDGEKPPCSHVHGFASVFCRTECAGSNP
jgi:hypothetical protein